MSSDDHEVRGPHVLADNRKGAEFSEGRAYRYKLWRLWDASKPWLAFIMLNPSAADETEDDPTIRRCIGYAKDWGYGMLLVGNLFALRATDPSELREHPNPVGSKNDGYLRSICGEAEKTIVAWGANGDFMGREKKVAESLSEYDLYALDTTKDGHPVHPLYQPADAEPVRWSP